MLKCIMRAPLRLGTSINSVCHYGTWALSPFAHVNAGRIQPVLQVDKVISMEKEYVESIERRQLSQKLNVTRIAELYEAAKDLKVQIRRAEALKDENSSKVQTMLKLLKEDTVNTADIKSLRETGKTIREELRTASAKFNNVNDELVELILSLPNTLDPMTPIDTVEKLREVVPTAGVKHWTKPAHLHWEKVPRVGPYPEFVKGSGVWAELELAAKSQQYLLENGFCETGNADFVRRILLEGTGLDPDQFLRIREPKIRSSSMAHATYLVGGASFPAFLALFAQSLLHSDNNLPIRYFVIGRSYEKKRDGPGTIQNSNVQAFIACRDAAEQEEEFLRLTDLMEKFYTDTIGVHIESNLLPAKDLRTYEKKKISFVTRDESKVIGDLATVGDYVSKRLLCCYIDPERAPKFLHLITGRFLKITDYLRPLPPQQPQPSGTNHEVPKGSKLA